MSKRIEDLTIEEAKQAISEINLNKKQLDIRKAELRKKLNRLQVEKSSIKVAKTKKLKSIQEDISKAKTKSAKDLKKKEKVRESDSFDNRIKSKEREIQSETKRILEIDEQKAHLNKIIEQIKQHINRIK